MHVRVSEKLNKKLKWAKFERETEKVLFFDFSKANAGMGTLEENFNRYCCNALDGFMRIYSGKHPIAY